VVSGDLISEWKKRPEDKQMLQQVYADDPWKMMVGCILLNQTTRTQVDKVRHALFAKYPRPEDMAVATPQELRDIIKPCGFYNRRTKALIRFSKEYLEKSWERIEELYGIGQYALDSWQIFVEGNVNIEPTDKELLGYLKRQSDGLEG
jgi:methyl-CpG-binding domain protein 4